MITNVISRQWGSCLVIILISHEFYENLSICFQGLLRNLGSSVSGDKKHFHITGNSCYIKFVPSKPSRIGLWMYQLVAQLSNGLPILIHMRMQAVETALGERAPMHQVVRDWRSVIESFSHRCILVFDSYYFSADSVNVLEEPLASDRPSRVKFIGAVTPTKFPLCEAFQGRVTIPGQWYGLYHRDTGHLLVHYYDVDASFGRKYVLTSAYTQYSRPHDKTVVPVYDDYRVLFDKCDKYNRRLYHCTWPHKSGGRNVLGDRGSQHNFAMSCMLQNVFNSWFQINNIDSQSVDLELTA